MLSKFLGLSFIIIVIGGLRRVLFRFRDEDFYFILLLNIGGENDDIEEEIYIEEEFLLVGMYVFRFFFNYKRSRFFGILVT